MACYKADGLTDGLPGARYGDMPTTATYLKAYNRSCPPYNPLYDMPENSAQPSEILSSINGRIEAGRAVSSKPSSLSQATLIGLSLRLSRVNSIVSKARQLMNVERKLWKLKPN